MTAVLKRSCDNPVHIDMPSLNGQGMIRVVRTALNDA